MYNVDIYSKFPFLLGARRLVDRHSREIKYRESTLKYFREFLNGWHVTNMDLPVIEVYKFLNSMVILKKLNSTFISRMFLGNFAKRFEYFFLNDLPNKSIRDEVLDFFNIDSNSLSFKHEIVQSSVPVYLMVLSRNVPGAEFRLINQALDKGTVTISNTRFVRMLRIRLEQILLKRIEEMKPADSVSFGEFDQTIDEIREQYKKYETMMIKNTTSPQSTGQQPPCIAHLIHKAKTEHHLAHMERVSLAIYLKSKNYSEDYILDIFRSLSDYSEKTTSYQLGKLTNYKMYNCSKMETEGICRKSEDRLNRCEKIQNPYNY